MAVSINSADNIITVTQESVTVTVQDVGIQGPAGVSPDTASLVTTGSNSFEGTQDINGNVTITGSLTVSGSNTFTVDGPTILQGAVTLSQILTGTASNAAYATTASYAESASTASYAITASYALNGGSGGGGSDEAFVSASGVGATGTITFTQDNGATQTVTLGSSFVTADLPNNEVVAYPTTSFAAIGDTSTDTFPEFAAAASYTPTDFMYSLSAPFNSTFPNTQVLMFVDRITSDWGSVTAADYIRFTPSGGTEAIYHRVRSALTGVQNGVLIRYYQITPVVEGHAFTGGVSASIAGVRSAPPEYALPTTGSFGLYTSAFLASSNLATNFTNQVALVSGSTPAGTWLYIGASPTSGTALSTSVGRYVGFSGDGSSWTYYQVNGQSYTNASSDYFIGLTAVDGEYTAAQYSNVYLSGFNRIPTHPYYRSLSHITHPITPSSTSDASGSIGDVSYDDSYFYVKTSTGWKRAALTTW